MLGGSPALLFLSGLGEAKRTLSLTRTKKTSRKRSPGNQAGKAERLGVQVGTYVLEWPCLISLHTSQLLCAVQGERCKTFPEGQCCLFTCLLLCFVNSPAQIRPKLGLPALCLILPRWHALSLQVSGLFTKHRRFSSLLLFLCQFEVYLPRLQYIKH